MASSGRGSSDEPSVAPGNAGSNLPPESALRNQKFADSPLEEAVRSELVSESRNSLLAGKIQGNSSIRARRRANGGQKWAPNQSLTGQFPTHPNREFFAALQGIKSGDQGNFRPDQGIPLSSAILAFALPAKPIVPTDLEHCREGEQGRPPRCSMSPKPISSSEAGVNVRPRHDANRSSSSLTRTTGVPGFAMAASD